MKCLFSYSLRHLLPLIGGMFFFFCGDLPVRADHERWQWWIDAAWNQRWIENLDIGVRWEGRFHDDYPEFSYYEVEPMLTWKYSPRWDFSLSYERDESLRGDEDVIHAPSVSATLKVPLQNWELNNVFRAEYDWSEDHSQDSTFMYRNRTDLVYRWKLGGVELTPYLSEEWFLEERRAEIVQNRLAVGIHFPVISHWNAGVYLMRLDEKTSKNWQWYPVFGMQVLAQF